MDREGRQDLQCRALEGDVLGIRDRLAEGDDIALADRQGFTPLHFAAQESRDEAVEVLLGAAHQLTRGTDSGTRLCGVRYLTHMARSRL